MGKTLKAWPILYKYMNILRWLDNLFGDINNTQHIWVSTIGPQVNSDQEFKNETVHAPFSHF